MAKHTIKGVKLHEVETASEVDPETGRRVLRGDLGDLRAGESFAALRETKRGAVVHLRGRR